MRRFSSFFLPAAIVLAVAATAVAQMPGVLAYYQFEETSGTAFVDSGDNGVDATFYRPYKYAELPAVDVSNLIGGGQFGTGVNLGTRSVAGVDNQIMIDIPASTSLPGAGDTFAVSFWLNSDEFYNSYGMLASYNLNGLEWSVGLHNSCKGIAAWSGDAGETGTATYCVDCSETGADLISGNFSHFVVQFDGANGISNVFVNGVSYADTAENNFWGNEHEGFTLGGRVLDARGFTPCNNNPVMDEFAIINGTVSTDDVNNLMTYGAADSSFDSRRTAHYALDDVMGTQITDSSANANHGTLVGYAPSTMGLDARDVAPASRTGVYGNGVEFANGVAIEHGEIASVTDLPERGEAFTVAFWAKHDENMVDLYGWDSNGVVMSWSNDPTPFAGVTDDTTTPDGLGFSVGFDTAGDGTLIVRRTGGNYISSVDQDMYGVYLGNGTSTVTGLGLDPTVFHHFAVSVDGNGAILGIYVDGQLIAKQINNGWGVTDEGTGVIGCRIKSAAAGSGFSGYLDDLVILDGVMTEEQIIAIMNGTIPPPTPTPLPGDTDNDGDVDDTDAQQLASNWLRTDATWAMGDFNNDQVVDDRDAAILAAHWVRGTSGEAAVPEPSTMVLVLGLALGLIFTRRCRAR